MGSNDTFGSRSSLRVGEESYEIHRIHAVAGEGLDVATLPYSLKILLEGLLRTEDGADITADHIRAVAGWQASDEPSQEIQFTPARVIMQDFTGVPAVVDLATMREAMQALGGDPARINPLAPAELVIDHSVIADVFGTPDAFARNVEIEYERNFERYQFLRWGQGAFDDFKVVPPGTGIVHQVNLEHLARVVFVRDGAAYPDTCVGTDSHTTMVNGLGVVGWGVGGIEAEAAMLGQPVSMLIPRVVGFKLSGELPEGATATDLVLTITQQLRQHGVVGKFVEFYGPGVSAVPLANRATIGNMSPEYGSTIAVFPIDDETTTYLRLTGRPDEQVALVEAYAKEQGLWHDPAAEPRYSEYLELDLSTVVPSIAGPKRPQDRICVIDAKEAFRAALSDYVTDGSPEPEGHEAQHGVASTVDAGSAGSFPASDPPAVGTSGDGDGAPREPGQAARRPSRRTPVTLADGTAFEIDHGAVAIAAITSCTNTSNPSVMIGAALLAKNAVERGLSSKPWVKTTLAPGSKVVMDYYERAGLTPYLDKLGFHLVGYGCTTCIGNSGPLIPEISAAVNEHDLAVVSVLSGNRNFEGRINSDVQMNYLASPPLVVAYALAGSMDVDLFNEPLGQDAAGDDVFLRDIWPSPAEVEQVVASAIASEMYTADYADVFAGDERWQSLPTPEGDTFAWDPDSTYVRKPPYFDQMSAEPEPVRDIHGARVLAKLGDSVTTDHISPAGAIKQDSPAGRYLAEHGVEQRDFNSYGARRGNHEVMIRGTFANIRLRNQLAPGTQGGWTRDFTRDDAPVTTIFEASQAYLGAGTPLVILAGKEYGSGSSRDWAAKGTALLGVRAVIAESYERIHRSNLIGMGVLPLQYPEGQTAESLGLTGEETFDITGVEQLNDGPAPRTVSVRAGDVEFDALVRIDTPGEAAYYRNGGIMQYVLRGCCAAETEGDALDAWAPALSGRVDALTFHSRALEGNPLGDPADRPLFVYLPPGYDDDPDRRYPSVYVIQGYTGQVRAWFNRVAYRTPFLEAVDAMFAAGDAPPCLVVLVDAFTRYGGSQFVDSPGTGEYHTYLCDEVVPHIDAHYRTLADPAHRGIAGKSSGGFGAMITPMLRPDLFGGLASHAGDGLYEQNYLPMFGKVVRLLRDYDADIHRWWDDFCSRPAFTKEGDDQLLMMLGLSACFSAEPDGTPVLPFDPRTGVVRDQVWQRWLAWDPIRMVPDHADAVRGLRAIWLDAGTRDEFYLDLAAVAFRDALAAVGVTDVQFELFDAGHGGIDYRYPLAMRYLAERLTPR